MKREFVMFAVLLEACIHGPTEREVQYSARITACAELATSYTEGLRCMERVDCEFGRPECSTK